MDANGHWYGLTSSRKTSPPRVLIIGAGSRGNAYAQAIHVSRTGGILAAIAEPIEFKRKAFGSKYIWEHKTPEAGQEFKDWKEFLQYETERRKKLAAGEKVEEGVDAAFICTLDEQHAEVITALAPLNLHILCEKPLATTLDACLDIYSAMLSDKADGEPTAVFGIGHVLRYSPHNMLLRKLLLQDKVIGDILSIEHTEPVGWWHFSHSYVRGNWRKESKTAPSLLTKSCHDIDVLLWLLCSPPDPESSELPHLPSTISSTGLLNYYRTARKPKSAGTATNCLSCPIEESCMYSAKKIYVDRHLKKGLTDWPIKIVNPEIEDCYHTQGFEAAEKKLLANIAEDYHKNTMSQADIDARPWFGRCVWESDNDVCDDQTVTMTWEDKPSASEGNNQFAKTATFHMIAQTEAQCERRGRIYGTTGEISYDSKTIRVFDFVTGEANVRHPALPGGGHGGGDAGLARQFIQAVEAVKNGGWSPVRAQKRFIGATLEEVVRSHAAVFAAEEARRGKKVVDWQEWWDKEVKSRMQRAGGEWEVV
jgi:predicted dehydrogenase